MTTKSSEPWAGLDAYPSTWAIVILVGIGLLIADTWASVIMIQIVPGVLQKREVATPDVIRAALVALAMTASQFALWVLMREGVSGSQWAIVVLAVPGVVLNIFSNFIILVGGNPQNRVEMFLESVRSGLIGFGEDPLATGFILSTGILSFLVSFLPEFLLDYGLYRLRSAVDFTAIQE